MSTSIHIPEGLRAFHIGKTESDSRQKSISILLKRVVADLQKWLHCSWAAGMIPGGTELVPELNVVCVAGDDRRREVPDLVCPVPGDTSTGLAAIVAVGPRDDGTPYSDQDHRLANALCEHIGGLIGNEQQDNADAEIARGIYDRLDHCDPGQIPGLEYSGQCRRADKSGGDFFDLLPRGERNLMVAIGNVAARGLPGGIMLGGALASVRALMSRGESLVQIAAELNRTLWELSPEGSFTSFLCAQIDPSQNQMRYLNAGHEPALLLRERIDQVDRLDPTGAILGLSRRSMYRERVVSFEPGDLLAAFTDGVAESRGWSGVLRILRDGMDCGVQDLAAHVLAEGETSADRTIVLVRCNKAKEFPEPMERYQLVAA
jgi:hypothetical protein